MKVLMISTDRKIFEEDSAVRQRIIEYGNLVDELHIIIFFKLGKNKIIHISNTNVWLYPTNSRSKLLYIFDAIKLAKNILENRGEGAKQENNKEDWLITTQDPFETGLVGWFIAKILKVKLQLQVHTDFLSKYFKKESFLNRIRVVIALFLLPRADGIRVVSERIKKAILASPKSPSKNKITVLPIFIDLEKIKNTELKFDPSVTERLEGVDLHKKYPQFDFIILMASRFEKEKNIFLVIDVMKEIVKKYPKTGLVIVGEGSEKDKLRKLVLKNKLEKNIIFENWQKDLISYYKTVDLFLLASSYEGFGMSLIEAGISGCPILTTNVGIVGDILKEGSIEVCKVGDKKCFVEKIIYAVENKEQLKEFSQKAQISIENNLTKNKEEYLREYKKDWERLFK